MAKIKGQPKRDALKDIRRYLQAGKSLEDAASCAGVSQAEAVELITKSNLNGEETFGIANIVASDVLIDSLVVLKNLATHGDTEEIQLGAAKELRRFAFDLMKISKPKQISIDAKIEEKDLWDS
jgi:hypothetical protein